MNETISINTEDFFATALKDLKINKKRQFLLESVAAVIITALKRKQLVHLNFISTYNSRSSQISQVWSSYASNYYNLNNIKSFSGGTEVTSFHRNTIKTLQKVGFIFRILEFSHQNPIYSIEYKNCSTPIKAFSKLYNNEFNTTPFIAITTSSNIRLDYPLPEAFESFDVPFNDIKNYNNNPSSPEEYVEINKQIAGEIHFIFERISTAL